MSLPALAATPWGAASLACEVLALAGMAPFLCIEASTLREYGARGWLSAWNVMDVVAYTVQARPNMLSGLIASAHPEEGVGAHWSRRASLNRLRSAGSFACQDTCKHGAGASPDDFFDSLKLNL